MKIKVIYEDNHLLVVEKPQGISVQSDGYKEDLLFYAKEYLKNKYQKPGNVFLGLVHRLDTNVGGVLIFARTSKAAARLSKEIRERSVEKEYIAVVEGNLKQEGLLTNKISKDEVDRKAILDEKSGKEASLNISEVSTYNDLSLCNIKLLTGRYHQIRFQLSLVGNSIYGDAKYGSTIGSENIALWCYRMKIKHPVKDEKLTFESFPSLSEIPWKFFADAIESNFFTQNS